MHLSILSIASLVSFIHAAALNLLDAGSSAATSGNVSTTSALQTAVNAIIHQIAAAEADLNKVVETLNTFDRQSCQV